MPVTLEKIQARLKQMEQEKIQLVGIYEGAIQDCQYWINELNTTKEDVDVG